MHTGRQTLSKFSDVWCGVGLWRWEVKEPYVHIPDQIPRAQAAAKAGAYTRSLFSST